MPYSRLLLSLLAAVLLAARPAAAQDSELPHLRELVGIVSYGTVSKSLEQAVEERMTLPAGYPQDLAHVVLAHLEVSPTGQVENPSIVPQSAGVNEVVAAAILAAVRRLPVLVPGHQGGQPVRTALTLVIRPGIAAAVANSNAENKTLRVGTIRPQPGETLGQLLHRVLPASCPDTATRLVRYAWFANAAGLQVFFDARSHGGQKPYDAILFVLNPLGAGAYNVQALSLGSMGDTTAVASVFFADANHDGQKDLLALTRCDLQEDFVLDSEPMTERAAHYQTTAIYYRGLNSAGYPRYEQQYRKDLNELPTAAAVRKRLATRPAIPATKAKKPARR